MKKVFSICAILVLTACTGNSSTGDFMVGNYYPCATNIKVQYNKIDSAQLKSECLAKKDFVTFGYSGTFNADGTGTLVDEDYTWKVDGSILRLTSIDRKNETTRELEIIGKGILASDLATDNGRIFFHETVGTKVNDWNN